jgi:hypothetical protein
LGEKSGCRGLAGNGASAKREASGGLAKRKGLDFAARKKAFDENFEIRS